MTARVPDQAPWVRARSIHARRGTRKVLADVDLMAQPGEIIVVSGANGSGKSTLLEILSLLRSPDAGEVHLFGKRARGDDLALRRRVTLAMQPALLLQRSVLKNVLFGLKARGITGEQARQAAQEALEATGALSLAPRDVGGLSAGERQRVNLARALALPVEILLLDEPTANLDAAGAEAVRALLVRLRDGRKHAIVIATPDDDALIRLADYVVRLS